MSANQILDRLDFVRRNIRNFRNTLGASDAEISKTLRKADAAVDELCRDFGKTPDVRELADTADELRRGFGEVTPEVVDRLMNARLGTSLRSHDTGLTLNPPRRQSWGSWLLGVAIGGIIGSGIGLMVAGIAAIVASAL